MKKQLNFAVVLLLAAAVALSALALMGAPKKTASADPQSDVFEIVESLAWENEPVAGWGSVNKNLDCVGNPIVVGGVTYSRNSIGTHALNSADPSDIVYDISAQSDEYPYLDLKVGQVDGGNNSIVFSVLADGVTVDRVTLAPGVGNHKAVAMSAYVKGAQKLTLRIELANPAEGFHDGTCAFLDVCLKKIEYDGCMSAVRAYDRITYPVTSGWTPGYDQLVYNATIAANPYSFDIYADHHSYTEGFGVHLKNVSYEAYQADKNNEANYVSLKWNVKDKGYALFSTMTYAPLGYGYHIDAFADGVELKCSGKLESVGTLAYYAMDARAGLYEFTAAIPENAEVFEIRVIADTIFNDGQINLMAPMFYEKSDMLISYDAVQTAGEVWPYQATRGYMWDGQKATYRDCALGKDVTTDNGIYFVAGTYYVFDLTGVNHNAIVGKLGRAPYFPDHPDAYPLTLLATVEHEDGTFTTSRSAGADWDNSGLEVALYLGDDAKTLTLKLESDNPAYSEAIFDNAAFTDKVAIYFDDALTLADAGDALTAPAAPTKAGYTFAGWKLAGETDAYDFTDKTVGSESMAFESMWTANTYNVNYLVKLGDGEPAANDAYPQGAYKYDEGAALPEAQAMEGYTFEGWYVGEEKVTALAAETYTDDITATAVYELCEYTVTFVNGENNAEQTVAYGDTAEAIDVPVPAYHTFDGWYLGDAKYDFATPVTADITLTARFAGIKFAINYTVSLDGAEAAAAEGYAPAEHTFGEETVLPEGNAMEGYDFDGWYIGNDKVTSLAAEAYTDDITLVGKYTHVTATYTVTFVVDGVELLTVNAEAGAKVELPEAPAKSGYNFKGWYAGDEEFTAETTIEGDVTVTAKFNKVAKAGCGSSANGWAIMIALAFVTAASVVVLKKRNA